MKCKDFQKQIDLEFSGPSPEIDSALRSHLESCEKCGLYYKETLQLRKILDSQDFKVLPGELDDITFEKIIKSPGRETVKPGILESIFSLRWAWVPAAVAAIIVMFVVLPNIDNIENGQSLTDQSSTYLGDGVFVASDQEASALVSSLIKNDSELETLADELILSSEIDDLIETLTDDEFEILYERLQNINGSS